MVAFQREAWTGKQVKYSFLRTFGCESFIHIDKDYRKNIEAKSRNVCLLETGLMILVIIYGIMKKKNH